MLSLPLAIFVITTYKYYKLDITEKIEDIREGKIKKNILKINICLEE